MTNVERRQTPRTTIAGHAYVNVEPNNGGIVLNVSDGGLCFHSFDPVQRNGKVRFWFAGNNRRIEADAALAWTDETHKAGLRFTALPAEAREQIRKWMIQSATPLPAGESSAAADLPPRPFRTLSEKPANPKTMPLSPTPVAAVATGSKTPTPVGGFSRGLVTGLLISAVIVSVFVFQNYRREFGESLIRLGERFAAKPPSQTIAMQPAAPVASSAPAVSQVVSPTAAPIPVPEVKKAQAPAEKPVQRVEKPAPEPEIIKRTFVNPFRPQQPKLEPARPTSTVAPTEPSAAKLSAKASAPASSPASSAIAPPLSKAATSESSLVPERTAVAPKIDSAKPEVQTESSTAANAASTSELYFDVGKFKNQSQAHFEIDKLTRLGFPATAVQKGFLWTNSYHILVGPYNEEDRARTTHDSLVSSGFKPRPFERGSRTFTIGSQVTLNGVRAPAGDYVISWESSLDDASVKLLHNDYPVASANAKWVKQDGKYSRDAYVYRRNADGSRTLLELRFGGTHQALVFGKSS